MQFSMKNTISYGAVTNARLVYDEWGKQCRYQARLSRENIFCVTWHYTKYHIYSLTNWAFSPPDYKQGSLLDICKSSMREPQFPPLPWTEYAAPVPLLDRFWTTMFGAFRVSNSEARFHKEFLRRSISCGSFFFFFSSSVFRKKYERFFTLEVSQVLLSARDFRASF